MKESLVPYAGSWSAVEDIFGYSLQLDFPGREAQFRITRNSWLKNIGMAKSIDIMVGLAPVELLENRWASKSFEEKRIILDKARKEREKFCSHQPAQVSR
jgi:hypothetical protein